MADMTTIKGRIAETIYPNGTGAITAESHQALLLEMADTFNALKVDDAKYSRFAQETENAILDVKESIELLEKKVENLPGTSGDFDPSGKYPDLMAGDLVGRGESVPAEFSFRASGGKSIKDGTAWIKRLKGNSVVWNQLAMKATKSTTMNGVTFTVNPDGSIIANGTASATAYIVINNNNYTDASHKYAVFGTPNGGSTTTYYFGDGNALNDIDGNGTIRNGLGSNSTFACRVQSGVTANNVVYRPRLIDLTKMFGAGNEPTTIEEFYARKPIVEDEYVYNEGEVIHMTAEGIKSVGDNAWDEEWESGRYAPSTGLPNTDEGIRSKNRIKVLPNENYWCSAQNDIFAHFYDTEGNLITNVYSGQYNYLPIKGKQFTTPANAATMTFYVVGTTTYNNDIMITLVHSGWKQDTDAGYQPYWEDRLIFDQRIKDEFPNGMSKWDMVYNKNGKGYIVHGLGEVDLWKLTGWAMTSTATDANRFVVNILSDMKGVTSSVEVANIISNRLNVVHYDDLYTNGIDACIALAANGTIQISSLTYTDIDSFVSHLQNIQARLWYELAEPTIIEYDEPFNLDYKVADFGTEQAIAEQPSAPISADIIYQFNAVDMIREHEIEINELQSIIATMQAQLASLTSNNG